MCILIQRDDNNKSIGKEYHKPSQVVPSTSKPNQSNSHHPRLYNPHPQIQPSLHPQPQPNLSPPTPLTSPLHRQKSKMTPHNRPSKEIRPREPTVFLRLIQIRKRTIGSRLIQPCSYTLENLRASLGRRDSRCLELPVGLCVQVARVEGEL
jgi:hypothetical protein